MRISWRPRGRAAFLACFLFASLVCVRPLTAAVIHGTVTDPLGAAVPNATVALVQAGKVVTNGRSGPDGSFDLNTSVSGRFFVLVAAPSFRQVSTASFFASTFDRIEQNVVLEPEWVRQQIVVTATGTPVPQAQLAASIDVLHKPEYENFADLVEPLKQMPGVNVVQSGQRGGVTSIFVRGGNSDANKVLIDGVAAEDIGGRFDFGNLLATGIGSAEVYRGPNSVLYGSDASAAVISFTTPQGSTPFPSLLYEGDAGNFGTYRNEVQLGGTHKKLDYYGAFTRFDAGNTIPMDTYHNTMENVNLGWTPTGQTKLRVTARNADDSAGLPGAYDFYGIANDGKQSDQDIFLSATVDHQFSDAWHAMVRYGLARKREQTAQWYAAGIPITTETPFGEETNYYGLPQTIRGANGYKVSGEAVLNFGGSTYPVNTDSASNRDQLYFQTDYKVSPHLAVLLGFHYEDERGAQHDAYERDALERSNYDYNLQIQGDFRSRFFYSLGGGVEKNQLYGTEGTPRVGLAFYPVRPRNGFFGGTKLKFNFAKGVSEPSLFAQFDSLYAQLQQFGEGAIAAQYNIGPIGAQRVRTYDGGVDQSFFNERVVLHTTYFHNEFGNQIEFVSAGVLPELGVSQSVTQIIQANLGGADVNTLAFRAQGAEAEIEYQVMRSLFVRTGYTYLDAVVQRSFSSDAVSPSYNTGPANGNPPSWSNLPIGASSPLRGARPFRRPPHTAFATLSYSSRGLGGVLSGTYVSRSDDSTFLGGLDLSGGNSLLLPNRNLDRSYFSVSLGLSYQFTSWVGAYTQLNNLTSDQHMGPIGYPSLPFNVRAGLRLSLGHQKN
jgi:vitamin B12 transporter